MLASGTLAGGVGRYGNRVQFAVANCDGMGNDGKGARVDVGLEGGEDVDTFGLQTRVLGAGCGLAHGLEPVCLCGLRGDQSCVTDHGQPVVSKRLDRVKGRGAIDAVTARLHGRIGGALVVFFGDKFPVK